MYLWSDDSLLEFGRVLGLSLRDNVNDIWKYMIDMRSVRVCGALVR